MPDFKVLAVELGLAELGWPYEAHPDFLSDPCGYAWLAQVDGRWLWQVNEWGDGPCSARDATPVEVVDTLVTAINELHEQSKRDAPFVSLGRAMLGVVEQSEVFQSRKKGPQRLEAGNAQD